MVETRRVRSIAAGTPVVEGAGVHLRRAIGNDDEGVFDPFLLLDDFRSDTPAHYRAGFPWHPHRGIETITYVLEGDIEHGDSLGHKGTIGAGDVQWMTAGSGIIHQEMPKGDSQGRMYGFQLWANLPASQKMMDPRYRDVKAADIPIVQHGAAQVRVICGEVDGVQGPVRDIVTDPEYLDVSLPPESEFLRSVPQGYTVFAYVIGGAGKFGDIEDGASPQDAGTGGMAGNGTLVLYGDGGRLCVSTGAETARFLLISGKPIGEPIAWRGPIVMNTREEINQAFDELNRGTFIRHS